jgi:preprotein translocase subunit SecE
MMRDFAGNKYWRGSSTSPAAFVAWSWNNSMNIIAKPVNFLREVKAELGKVAWSTREELLASTIVVIVVTVILGVFIGLIDAVLSKLLTILFK